MEILSNPYRGIGLTISGIPAPSTDANTPFALLAKCPAYEATPLVHRMGLHIKDERGRMGLGSFKALGAAYVIAQDAQSLNMAGRTYVTASAGNHGLSVAAGAQIFGAKSVIYLAEMVPSAFADRLRNHGAKVVVQGADYEASMKAAQNAASGNGWILLSDSSWDGYYERPHRLMEGYLAMAAEAADQMDAAPDHIFLQAGVGGLAGACAAYFRRIWGDVPKITVVEPAFAPALHGCIEAGRFVAANGPSSDMGRLDCKEASLIALKGLSRDADAFALITEDEAFDVLPQLAAQDLRSTTSGSAGIAAALLSNIPDSETILCFLSEGP